MSNFNHSSNQHKTSNHPFTRWAVLGLALVVMISGQAARAQAGEPQAMRDLLCELIQLADNKNTRDYADHQFAELSRVAPNDTNLPYLHALVMVDNYKNREAVAPSAFALANDSTDPNAWKLNIWLTISVEKDYESALKTMEAFAARLNVSGQMDADAYQALQSAEFLGRVFGFLAGPAEMDHLKLSIAEQSMVAYLTPEQSEYFNGALTSVLDEFSGRSHQISDQRVRAQETEELIRNRRLANSSAEREYLRGQMEQVEDHRMQARQVTSNERNVIAANRGSGYTYPRRFSGVYATPFGVAAGHYRSGYHGYEYGLDNRHYADVNRREAEYNNYLSYREQNLRRRLNRLQKDEERLLRKPNPGNSREVRSNLAKANSLRTYVALPVDAENEIERILAMY